MAVQPRGMITPLVCTMTRAKQDLEMYCDKCSRVLLQVDAGQYHVIADEWCDCVWNCCTHSQTNQDVRGYTCHPAHLKHRPRT